MRIAFVHSFYRSSSSGENRAVEMQAAALQEAGHEVTVFAKHSSKEIHDGQDSLRAGLRVISGLGASPGEEIKAFAPDIVHVHNLFPNWSESWLRGLEVPLVATLHNFRPLCAAGTLSRKGKFCDLCPTRGSMHAIKHACYQNSRVKSIPLAIATRDPAVNPILRFADKLVFLSEESLEQYEKHGPSNLLDRAVIVPNFAEDVPDAPGKSAQPGQRNWLYVGRLSEEKGILPLLLHWPQNEGLVVVGDGPLYEEARRISRGKEVTFLGNLSKDRVAEQMARARGLIFPSICLENSPLVVAEALSHSLPVIAKSGNVAAQLVSHFGAGAVIEDFSEIRQPLEMVSGQRAKMGHLARKLFEQQFSQKKWTKRMNAVYEDACAGDTR